ncbi:hypothetical protein ACFP3I_11660 [Chryseobacterium arachidis]
MSLPSVVVAENNIAETSSKAELLNRPRGISDSVPGILMELLGK